MRIGLDLDGTVALYDEVFHRCAVAQFGMPPEIDADKLAIRAWFWKTPEGRRQWIELQGVVYGLRMDEARLAPRLNCFLLLCRENGIPISIISHKTEWPVVGPRVNLRDAARQWLERHVLGERLGIGTELVFFESTREEKIQRIVAQRCTHFVDDLREVFLEQSFPVGVSKLLYSPGGLDGLSDDLRIFSSWESIRDYFFKVAG